MTLKEIARLYGGKGKMAKYFGVSRRAIWEWDVDKIPIRYLPRFIDELSAYGIELNLEEINGLFRGTKKK